MLSCFQDVDFLSECSKYSFDCDIKTNNQTCTKQIKSEILLTRNLYLYVPSNISRIWCNSKTASHAMLLQWYMIIYVFPVFCKYWLISEIYLLLLLLLLWFTAPICKNLKYVSQFKSEMFWTFNLNLSGRICLSRYLSEQGELYAMYSQ